jgi:UDP-N-acetylglucosamine/UDP-N-acetylgalactosamine diphosphorylase
LRAFESSRWFGLDRQDLFFLVQGTVPAVDARGRLLLASPSAVFMSPDGHGGSLRALKRSGALADMRRRGVEDIFYFQVDNPLVDVCDPIFLGGHRLEASDFSSKVVPKRDPREKVGILVRKNGRPAVIEYSDLPEPLCDEREPDGTLRFRAGNIAIHCLRREFVEQINEGGFRLPWHLARKDIPAVDVLGRPVIVKGIKFETFVFDALPLAQSVLVMEVERRTEFSPIKNKNGEDSADSCLRDQTALFASWLEQAGVRVPRAPDGSPRHRIEISPLFADGPEALIRRRAEIPEVIGDLLLEER